MKSFPYNLQPDDYIRCFVEDTGLGMPKEVRKQIFDPFFTTKEDGRGTGLGLAAVHGTIEGHGGEIAVYSEPDRGTVFYLYLPIAKGGENVPAGDVAELNEFTGKVALVIDDEEVMLSISKGILEELGCEVMTFADGDDALQAMADYDGPLDFAMIDIILAGRRGTLVAQELLVNRPRLPSS